MSAAAPVEATPTTLATLPPRVRAARTSLRGARVLVVGINYFPETTGIAPYTTAMCEALAGAGAAVEVVTGIPHYPQWRIAEDRYRDGRVWSEVIGGLPITRVAHRIPSEPTLRGRARMEASFFVGARRQIAARHPDAIIAVTPSLSGAAAAVAAAGSAPVGMVVQDLTGAGARQSGTTGGRAAELISAAEHVVLRRAACVGVITPRFGEILRAAGVTPDRVFDVANFSHVEPVAVGPAEARRRLGWTTDRTLVVHTGNMGMKQGLESVIDAARVAERAGLPIEFVLVGDGNQRSALERMAADVRGVRILPAVDDEAYPYVLAAADVLLLNERPGVLEMSMPSKLTSYVTAARPIIAAVESAGIVSRVLRESSAAVLVPPGDPTKLVHAVRGLMNGEPRRAELVDAARALGAGAFSPEAAVKRYEDFARAVLARAR